jgi:hypothetical protein
MHNDTYASLVPGSGEYAREDDFEREAAELDLVDHNGAEEVDDEPQ